MTHDDQWCAMFESHDTLLWPVMSGLGPEKSRQRKGGEKGGGQSADQSATVHLYDGVACLDADVCTIQHSDWDCRACGCRTIVRRVNDKKNKSGLNNGEESGRNVPMISNIPAELGGTYVLPRALAH